MSIPVAAELPIWISWVGVVVVLVTALEAGYRTGLWRRRRDAEWEAVGDIVSPTMFALLGVN